jgi:hypothetical protein
VSAQRTQVTAALASALDSSFADVHRNYQYRSIRDLHGSFDRTSSARINRVKPVDKG